MTGVHTYIAAVILSVAAITVGRITRGLVAICIIDALQEEGNKEKEEEEEIS